MTISLVSYPRSGNHIVRAILEYGTGQPTIGVRGRAADPAIHTKPANSNGLIEVDESARPVAFKSHTLPDVYHWWRQGMARESLILILRPPSNCITSQVYRGLPGFRPVRAREIRLAVERAAADYQSLLHLYLSFPEERRLLVRFEDLLSAEPPAGEIIRFAGGTRIPDANTMKRLLDISRNSQESLKASRRERLYERVRLEVERSIPDDTIDLALSVTAPR